jgi:predicted transcriptional regulator YheO
MDKTPFFFRSRNDRIQTVMKTLSNDGIIGKREFIAKMALYFGCSRRVINEYVSLLIDAGHATENDKGNIEWVDKSKT